MLRTERPLRPVWRRAHAAVIAACARYLMRGQPGSGAYLRASFGYGDQMHGLSDVDLAVVLADSAHGHHECPAVRRRWARLCRLVPGLSHLVQPTVYERRELEDALAATTLTTRGAIHLAPAAPCDPAGLRYRPGLFGPLSDWRHVAGARNVSTATRPQDGHQRRIAAWLELQRWWREALFACANPGGPRLPYLCVKLVAEPARIWIWLVHGEALRRRREVLDRALALMPEEREAIESALRLHAALPRSPEAPLAELLPAFLRLSARLGRLLEDELAAAPTTDVRLDWGGEEELVLGPGAREPLRAATGGEPRLLPLADWHARVWPVHPDHAMAPLALDLADPDAIGAAARAAGDWGPYAAVRHDGLLVLPGPGLMRALQTATTDPVSFALLDGEPVARFRDVPGWSVHDSARRALEEHRAWLGTDPVRPGAALTGWMDAQARTTQPTAEALGLLLTAARAALFHDSLAAGEPVLPLTLAATARRLGHADPASAGIADEALGRLRAARAEAGTAKVAVVAALREAVLRLPAYSFESPWPVRGAAAGTIQRC